MAEWLEQFLNIVELYAFEIFLLLIISLFLYYTIKYHVLKLLPHNKKLERLSRFLTELDAESDEKESAVDDFLNKNKDTLFFSQAWKDYSAYRSVEPDILVYFNDKSLVDEPASRSQAVSAPSSLMAIGLLMSFFYLFICFMGPLAVLTSQDELATVISKVIGLGIASITASYIYNLVDKILFDKTSKEVYKIQRMLQIKLAETQHKGQLDQIALSIDNLSRSMTSYIKANTDLQNDSMNQLVNSFLNKLNHEMKDQLTEFGKSLQAFTEAHHKSTVQTEALVGKLIVGTENQIDINQASMQIVQAIAEYQEQISNSSQSLAVSLRDLQDISNVLSNVISVNSESLAALKQERDDLTREYTSTFQGFRDMLRQYQKESSAEIDKLMNKFTEASAKTFNQIEGTVMKSMDSWISSNKSMIQNIEEQSKSLISVSREIALRLNELNSSLRSTIKEFTQSIETGSVNTLTEFDKGLAEITQRLSLTITEIRDSIDDLPAVIGSIKERFEQAE